VQNFFISLTLFLPILAANQGPGLARRLNLPLSHMPVSRRLLGENKTVAAYYAGPALGMLVFGVYALVCAAFFKYPDWIAWLTDGLVIGLGAVLGDQIKSFIKRRLDRPAGSPWFFDRIDFAIGGGLAAWWRFDWVTWRHVLIIILLAYPVHLIGNQISHARGWRDTPH
jgi:CDP-2,3-bis-(O-geranylgeranyl)-sn-glycerol synthase